MPGLSILIVDASDDFSKAAQRFLMRNGNIKQIEITAEIQEAIDMAAKLKPSLILMDLELLKKAGPSFCQQLKKEAPGAIIIGLTMFNNSFIYSEPLENRAIDTLVSRECFANNIVQIIRSLLSENLT